MEPREVKVFSTTTGRLIGTHLIDEDIKIRIKKLKELIQKVDFEVLKQIGDLLEFCSGVLNNYYELKKGLEEQIETLTDFTGYDPNNPKFSLQDQINQLDNEIGAIKKCECDGDLILELSKQIGDLEKFVGTQSTQLDNLLGNVNEIKTRVSQNELNISSIQTDMESIEGDILTNKTGIEDIETEMARMKEVLDYDKMESYYNTNHIGVYSRLELNIANTEALNYKAVDKNLYERKISEIENRLGILEQTISQTE